MFFFNDTATTEIYALSLHDALPISLEDGLPGVGGVVGVAAGLDHHRAVGAVVDGDHAVADQVVVVDRDVVGDDHAEDRKSTRLNSSHANISYAAFCLKKKKHL